MSGGNVAVSRLLKTPRIKQFCTVESVSLQHSSVIKKWSHRDYTERIVFRIGIDKLLRKGNINLESISYSWIILLDLKS